MKFENVWIESYIMGMICTYQYIMTIQYPFYKDGFGPLDACGLNYLMYSIKKTHACEWFLDGYQIYDEQRCY